MELSKAQRAFLAIPSRWPPILLGIILSLFISAIFTSNFAMRVIPASESASPASSSSPPSSSITSISSQLFMFLFRRSHSKAGVPHESWRISPPSMSVLPSSSSTNENTEESHGTNDAQSDDVSAVEENPSVDKSKDVAIAAIGSKTAPLSTKTPSSESEGFNNSSIGSNRTESVLPLEEQHGGSSPNVTESSVHEDNPSSSSSSMLSVDDSQPLLDSKANVESQRNAKFSPQSEKSPNVDAKTCDLSMGKWVEEDSYPLYRPSTCPFVDEAFSCQQNGRPDANYNKWRWAPKDCNVPRFNGTHLLEILRGKRLVFVGDSLNRNQWESMLCMLREPLPDKGRLVQVHGGRISKLPGAYVFKYLDYDCKVEFYTSPYLVDKEDGQNQTDFRIRLDRMDQSERRWRKANVLVFNTGHWWTTDKIGEGDNRFQEGSKVHEKMDVSVAYTKALSTWAKWVDTYVNPQNTTVFFRGYSPVHYIGGQWNSGGQCQDETQPIFNESFIAPYPDKMQALEEILPGMKLPVQVLNITRLSDFRKDAHPALYGHATHQVVQYQDCSHWCLPGVPDTWNELLYFALANQPALA